MLKLNKKADLSYIRLRVWRLAVLGEIRALHKILLSISNSKLHGYSMISLVIVVEVNPEQVDKFITYLTEEAADAIANEPGCRNFMISQSVTERNVFTLAEFYDDHVALDEHRKTPHFLLFQERVSEYNLILNKREVVTANVLFPK